MKTINLLLTGCTLVALAIATHVLMANGEWFGGRQSPGLHNLGTPLLTESRSDTIAQVAGEREVDSRAIAALRF